MTTSSSNKYIREIGTAVVYLLLCALYFTPLPAPSKMCYPVAWLAMASLGREGLWLILALGCSALGDLFGSVGEFLPQIGAFGVAQVCYIIQLSRQRRPSPRSVVRAATLPTIILLVALVITLPNVETPILKIGTVVYGVAIGTMVFFACRTDSLPTKLGAVCFMLSDFVLSLSLFATPHPAAHLLYLPLYWLGQGLLWWGITRHGANSLHRAPHLVPFRFHYSQFYPYLCGTYGIQRIRRGSHWRRCRRTYGRRNGRHQRQTSTLARKNGENRT